MKNLTQYISEYKVSKKRTNYDSNEESSIYKGIFILKFAPHWDKRYYLAPEIAFSFYKDLQIELMNYSQGDTYDIGGITFECINNINNKYVTFINHNNIYEAVQLADYKQFLDNDIDWVIPVPINIRTNHIEPYHFYDNKKNIIYNILQDRICKEKDDKVQIDCCSGYHSNGGQYFLNKEKIIKKILELK